MKLVHVVSHLPDAGQAGFTLPSHAQTQAQRPFLGVKTPGQQGGGNQGAHLPSVGGGMPRKPTAGLGCAQVSKKLPN